MDEIFLSAVMFIIGFYWGQEEARRRKNKEESIYESTPSIYPSDTVEYYNRMKNGYQLLSSDDMINEGEGLRFKKSVEYKYDVLDDMNRKIGFTYTNERRKYLNHFNRQE